MCECISTLTGLFVNHRYKGSHVRKTQVITRKKHVLVIERFKLCKESAVAYYFKCCVK